MDKIKFYCVSERYIEYLKRYDFRVPNITYESREKFVSGVILEIDNMKYYAPVSSFNKQQATNYVIKFGDYPVGSIRFSFMFPVPESEIKLKDFRNENINYKHLVIRELQVVDRNKEAIRKQATQVYKIRTSNRNNLFNSICCDFKLLETKCKEFEKQMNKNKSNEKELELV